MRFLFFIVPLAFLAIAPMTLAQDPPLDSKALAEAKTFTSLEEAFKRPERVYKLKLWEPQESLLSEIGTLVNLQVLEISASEPVELPPEIGLLVNLQKLDVLLIGLTRLPTEIGNLQYLEELNVAGNDFGSVPPEIFLLTNLRRLNLAATSLTELPAEIGNLKNLIYLTLSDNELARIPEEFGDLQVLEELNVSGNDFEIIPPEILLLTNLRRLSLAGNSLMELPPEISELAMIESLYLGENRIKSLPTSIADLQNLDVLSLASNRLTTLPPEIGNLRNLRVLDLSGNQLAEIPTSIIELEKLLDLDLTGNQLTELPPELKDLLHLPVAKRYDSRIRGIRRQRGIRRMNPNRRFLSVGRPLFGLDGALETVTAWSLPAVQEISDLVSGIEAWETGRMLSGPPEEEQLDRAAAGLNAHLEGHPDDVAALILTARLGRFLIVWYPVVSGGGDEAASFETPYLPLHAALDHAIRLEPTSGEAHYWKARLYGMTEPDLRSGVMAYRHFDLERAIAFAAQAVDLDPGNTAYREALALYLVAAGEYGEAMEATRSADGGKNTIYLLLSDLENFPIPDAAKFLPEESRNFAEFQAIRGRYENYPFLRVRMYSFPGPVSELEVAFREVWPGIVFYEMDRTEGPDGAVIVQFGQHFRWRHGALRPAGSKRKLEKSQRKNTPGGIMLGLMELHRPSEEMRAQFRELSADPFSVITIMNDSRR